MNKDINQRALLIILDGWGLGDGSKSDAISQANTPFIDSLKSWPNAQLGACGENVGLPEGQMGNSEVGHLNIGAGRVVYQDYVRINKAVKTGELAANPTLLDACKYARENHKTVHFIGLMSDGGVHSNTKHLIELCRIAAEECIQDVCVHVLTDGRDTDPKSGFGYISDFLDATRHLNTKVASLCGRYYTMDRDNRWERVKEGYDLLVNGKGKHYKNILQAVQDSYREGITDEFIKPVVLTNDDDTPIGTIKEGDVVVCYNFRTDRLRQITTALTQKNFPEQDMHTLPLRYLTMTTYDEGFKNVEVLFDKQDLSNTLGEVLSNKGLTQLRIAETEKYAHVTFFFNGGREEPFNGEKRILVPSPKVATYDLQPAMSAVEVTEKLVVELEKKEHDFICLNFANADMVGHTGIYPAIIEALETVDKCVKEVIEAAIQNGYAIMLTADHGNSDFTINADNSPNTAHTTNPVPVVLINSKFEQIKSGKLCDIAPTILKIMGLEIPKEISGDALV